ncbi:MAG: hypothetical protein SVV80_05185 [Planctomycetota bacterium]|nr:hypothetical protein [Planctomycetota bacterium]
MARVVQRRGGPPYMVILLAFLFLVSTTLAVLFYVRNDESGKELLREQDRRSELAKKDRKKAADIDEMVIIIAGKTLSPEAAKKEADEILKLEHAKDYSALSLAIREMDRKIADLNSQVEQGKKDNIELRNEKDKAIAEIDNISKGLMKQLSGVKQELADAKSNYEQGLAAKQTQLDEADADFKAIIKQKDQRINTLAAEVDGKTVEIQKIQDRIDLLLKKIREEKGKTGEVGELLVRKPAGKIIKVFSDEGLCYINLGRQDRVAADLPFSVFSAHTGVPKDGKPKAKIVIVNVTPTTSECRIVESDKDDPIVEGDLLVNLIFSPTRTHNFVVEGEFDLYGEGSPDPLANRRVRAMIENFGGKVADAISVSTDFVVMGEEPSRPPRPAEDAPPAAWQIYNEKMKTYDYYKQVKASAISLQIPVLNTNRFLAFSGYAPKKRLVEE